MEYELTPAKKYNITREGGKGHEMTKEIAQAPAPRPAKRYQPSRWEVGKTIAIAVLISGIVAFVLGMKYANSQHSQIEQAVTAATSAKK